MREVMKLGGGEVLTRVVSTCLPRQVPMELASSLSQVIELRQVSSGLYHTRKYVQRRWVSYRQWGTRRVCSSEISESKV
jgi:hypothetical protein